MLASIVPLGERARNRPWGVTAAAYVVASLLAGAWFGAVLGLLGGWVPGFGALDTAWVVSLAAGVCLTGAAMDLGIGGLRLPTVRRQVNEDWLVRYRGWACGVGFGFQLGLGVVTIVTSATVYVVLLLAFLSASPTAGCALGAAFGLVRAIPLLTMRRATTPARLSRAHRRMQGWAAHVQRAAVGVQGAAAVVGILIVASS
jgi:sulfite exporter TauE/SafE